MKFNHLNVPDHWQHYWTRYPEGYTILEALINWVSQVNAMVDDQNNLNKTVKDYRKELDTFIDRFDPRLREEVTKILTEWNASGFLSEVLNQTLLYDKADRLDRVINVKQMPVPYNNAKGDGVTDDTQVFQDAADILASNGGGKVIFGGGDFVFTKPVRWSSKVSLQGIGYTSKIKMVGELFSAIVNTDNPSTGSAGVSEEAYLTDINMTDFQIDASGLTHLTSSADGKGIFILYMKRCNFERLYIHDTIGTGLGCDFLDQVVIDKVIVENCGRNWTSGGVGQSGIGVGTNSNNEEALSITNCVARNNGNYGIFVETQNNPVEEGTIRSEGARIINNFVYGNRLGIGNKGSGGVIISGNDVFYNQYGVQFTEGSEKDILVGNRIENNTQQGVFISADYKGKLSIKDNKVRSNRKGIELIGGGGILKDLEIIDNEITENQFAGFQTDRVIEGLRLKDNKLKGNARADVAGQRQGVLINANLDGFELKDNYFAPDNTQLVAVQFKSGITLKDGTISDNELSKYSIENMLVGENVTEINVTTRNNSGIMEKLTGSDTLSDVEFYKMLTFPKQFDKAPSAVIINPTDGTLNTRVWATDVTRFGFIARQDVKTTTPFNYTVIR